MNNRLLSGKPIAKIKVKYPKPPNVVRPPWLKRDYYSGKVAKKSTGSNIVTDVSAPTVPTVDPQPTEEEESGEAVRRNSVVRIEEGSPVPSPKQEAKPGTGLQKKKWAGYKKRERMELSLEVLDMLEEQKYKLTSHEYNLIKDAYDGFAGGITCMADLDRLMESLNVDTKTRSPQWQSELEALFETHDDLDFKTFLHIMTEEKEMHVIKAEDGHIDVVEAFSALGGHKDVGQAVDADVIRKMCKDFGLTINIDRLLHMSDQDGNAELDFQEFAVFLQEDDLARELRDKRKNEDAVSAYAHFPSTPHPSQPTHPFPYVHVDDGWDDEKVLIPDSAIEHMGVTAAPPPGIHHERSNSTDSTGGITRRVSTSSRSSTPTLARSEVMSSLGDFIHLDPEEFQRMRAERMERRREERRAKRRAKMAEEMEMRASRDAFEERKAKLSGIVKSHDTYIKKYRKQHRLAPPRKRRGKTRLYIMQGNFGPTTVVTSKKAAEEFRKQQMEEMKKVKQEQEDDKNRGKAPLTDTERYVHNLEQMKTQLHRWRLQGVVGPVDYKENIEKLDLLIERVGRRYEAQVQCKKDGVPFVRKTIVGVPRGVKKWIGKPPPGWDPATAADPNGPDSNPNITTQTSSSSSTTSNNNNNSNTADTVVAANPEQPTPLTHIPTPPMGPAPAAASPNGGSPKSVPIWAAARRRPHVLPALQAPVKSTPALQAIQKACKRRMEGQEDEVSTSNSPSSTPTEESVVAPPLVAPPPITVMYRPQPPPPPPDDGMAALLHSISMLPPEYRSLVSVPVQQQPLPPSWSTPFVPPVGPLPHQPLYNTR
eukprot:TRINITY_DN68112_c12_g3_i1.p1 TRINITY_DN68112_c12_g3~~TRINITY_DN68112_c12_g3_i1.p1  ORF type:complete len:851 (-),score=88.05 TRINITY_DN68112_c12_g3_i1:1604-4063(-)